ncbi:hypothetical protein [Nocardioides sp. AE5]|uniref:hypothetical protein n=1 Tax=Nocardioides sp. AE5 TaxID=2962573 RepID=UPI002880E4C2|nr:hypothetical protein [Nocardioides sp. AE5]MDT0203729.1 hypothetical protein [Nocardioides sp. AE5]
MRRSLLVVPAVLAALAVTGCGDKEVQNTSGEPTGDPTSSSAPATPNSAKISEEEFCDNIVAVISSTDASKDPLVDLLSDGMPAEMSPEATAGVQVLIDNAGKMSDPKDVFKVYQDLPEADQESLQALGMYVGTACGEQMLKQMVALLPSEVPEGLKSLSPEDLPSQLQELLPSELPSELKGIIPEELATLIPQEWLELVPEEYRELFESPAPSATPTV